MAGELTKAVNKGILDLLDPRNQGINQDDARELAKRIRDMKLKVQAQIQGDQLRVQGKKRDDLQEVIAEMKALDFRVPLQFVNYRD